MASVLLRHEETVEEHRRSLHADVFSFVPFRILLLVRC